MEQEFEMFLQNTCLFVGRGVDRCCKVSYVQCSCDITGITKVIFFLSLERSQNLSSIHTKTKCWNLIMLERRAIDNVI